MPMTSWEKRLFKEKVIRDYKIKLEKARKKPSTYTVMLKRLRRTIPINIGVGLVASILLIYFNGWRMFAYLMLSGIIWLTLITTLVSTFLDRK